ncbi:single-stranded-DNA-specific exonuclease RecJ [Syntrophotalea acetylenivorans]|uniref:Single-stranded-DNA-specific exonuclease RecJ n=1 Tax=Syntrophotalea acetylenivorans TaxID=1842532 RepID=A0A1L3GMF2_9BACT|nr:single-stranded-DNA-specific exonuclease RecJ [Syntrophotalea acetylenivorans]APG27126.1 single-stranded-DNA-specific exonuclease RecJ [Syntrophotalea acetylenivorans]
MDGITASALLVENLRSFGAPVDYYIPLRLVDGYGLSGEALQRAADSGAKVAVSVDCGVSAHKEARLAKKLGLDLIITDHHQPPEQLPEALAVINPHRPDCAFPDKGLAGVGVAFMLLVALRSRLRQKGWFQDRPEPDLRCSLDLVALGTIADIAPLNGLNRILVKAGLTVLNQGQRPGIAALREVADVKEVNCGSVGFRLAPRLNAAGRLQDAAQGVGLLLEASPVKALESARQLDDCNRQRQMIEQQTLEQALEQLAETYDPAQRSIVLADPEWHSGVIGIVASRLVERFYRPTVLIAVENGIGKGSARSIRGFHLYRALHDSQQHLSAYGGHEFAAGLSIPADNIDAFASTFETVAEKELSNDQLQPRHLFDQEVLLEELTPQTVAELERLAPFGVGNPQPLLVARQLRAQQVQILGDKHLRFTALQGGYSQACIAFGMAERIDELAGEFDLLFTPGINEWRGRSSVQLKVKDLRAVESVL